MGLVLRGPLKLRGSEVENVKQVQPAGGRAGFNRDAGILRPELCTA